MLTYIFYQKITCVSSSRSSQTKLLAGVVVKKRSSEAAETILPKRQKAEVETECKNTVDKKAHQNQSDTSKRQRTETDSKCVFSDSCLVGFTIVRTKLSVL